MCSHTKLFSSVIAGLLVAIILATEVDCAEQTTLRVQVRDASYDGKEYWIGVFRAPIEPESEPLNWHLAETDEFSLKLRHGGTYVLAVLQRGSVPIQETIALTSKELVIEIEFRAGQTLSGFVVSEDELPISNVAIDIQHASGLREFQLPDASINKWTSDENGGYEITGLQSGEYELTITPRANFPTSKQFLEIKKSSPLVQTRHLRVPHAYFVTGIVVNTLGEEIENATVIASESARVSLQQPLELFASTNERGAFAIGPFLKGRPIQLLAEYEDHGFSYGNLVNAGQKNLTLIVHESIRLLGRVVDADTSEPLDEFIVQTVAETGLVSSSEISYRTNTFEYRGVDGSIDFKTHWLTHQVTISASGYSQQTVQLSTELDTVQDLGVISLKKSKDVVFRLVNATTGNPIGHAKVDLTIHTRIDGSDNAEPSWAQTETSEDGQFAIVDLPRENLDIEVSTPNYHICRVSLIDSDENVEVKCTPKPTTIRGVVQRDDGLPLQGQVQVDFATLEGNALQQIAVDESGVFEICTDRGQFRLQAYSIEDGVSSAREVEVGNTLLDEITLTIGPGGSITGVVRGLEFAETVDLSLVDSKKTQPLRSKDDIGNGPFSIRGLSSGNYVVEALSSMGRGITLDIEVEKNEVESLIDLDFSGTSTLHGKLTVDGTPIARSRVVVRSRSKSGVTNRATTQDDGAYEIHGLHDGEYVITNNGQEFSVLVSGDTHFDVRVVR